MITKDIPDNKKIIDVAISVSGINHRATKAAWLMKILIDKDAGASEFTGRSDITTVPRAGLQAGVDAIMYIINEAGKSGLGLEDFHIKVRTSSRYLWETLSKGTYKTWRLSQTGHFFTHKGAVKNHDLWSVLFILCEKISISFEMLDADSDETKEMRKSAISILKSMISDKETMKKPIFKDVKETPYSEMMLKKISLRNRRIEQMNRVRKMKTNLGVLR